MKLNTKTIIVIAVALFVLLTGANFLSSFRKPAPTPPQQAMNPFDSFPPPVSSLPDTTDMSKVVGDRAMVSELMTKYNLKPRLASYIAQSKMQILDQTDTSVHFAITFPDQTILDETATIAADPAYTPTPADLEQAVKRNSKVYGAKLTHKKTGPQAWTYTLQYHVPYQALPPDLQQKVRPASSSNSGAAHLFDLVPPVYASEGEVAGFEALSVVSNYFAESYKAWQWEAGILEDSETARSLGADLPLALVDLFEDGLTFKNWMDEINSVEDCAKHPTNPLSQKASYDPNYQHDVLDQMADAKGDVESTVVPTLASDAAGYLGHFLPFGGGAVATLILSTQDDAVSEYAEGRIGDARKYVVPCDKTPMTPGDLRPMEGALTYTYILKTADQSNTQTAEGKFPLNKVSGGLAGEGTAKFTQELTTMSTSKVPSCQGVADSVKSKGDLKITAQAGGTPFGGVIELHVSGNVPVVEAQMVGEGANKCIQQTKNYMGSYGIVCHFDHIDMVHGGTFSTFAEDNGGRGTCTIELERK